MTNEIRKIKMASAISTLADLNVDQVSFDISDLQDSEYSKIAVYFNIDGSADSIFYLVINNGEMEEIARFDCYAGSADIHRILSMIFDKLNIE